MSGARLNKELWTEVGKLKNLNANSDPKFIVDKTPFDDLDDDEDVQAASAIGKEYVILGKIIPNSEVYKKGAYQIEMKLTSTFPIEPPTIRFITKIYHPNVSKEGEFCNELLKKTAKWTSKTSLVDVVRAVIKHIDEPDIDYALSFDLAKQYLENRSEFNRIAADFVKQYAIQQS